jgi:unsaturated rhamnogalacturonyl hydrolase
VKHYLIILLSLILGISSFNAELYSQNQDSSLWSTRIADSFLERHLGAVTFDSGSPNQKWNYEQGLILIALYQKWLTAGDGKYLDFIQQNLDKYICDDGTIKTYKIEDYNLDNLAAGRVVLNLYERTKDNKYKRAADLLKKQLENQPRTKEGGFWHKKIYPYQMWLDGLFMAEPFYAKYSVMFNEPNSFDDIADQFIFISKHVSDPKTGLLYHGWDESKKQKWANPTTGCSPSFWARSMGWYLMALVDVLDYYPASNSKRQELVQIFRNLADAVLKYRDPKTYLWYQVIDQGSKEGNYLEASSSCMFAYAFAKGSNNSYLDKRFYGEAEKTFGGIIKHLTSIEDDEVVNLYHTCRSAGLGGDPYRDGSYEYYIGESQRTNDMKGIGSFLLAAIELEKKKNGIK